MKKTHHARIEAHAGAALGSAADARHAIRMTKGIFLLAIGKPVIARGKKFFAKAKPVIATRDHPSASRDIGSACDNAGIAIPELQRARSDSASPEMPMTLAPSDIAPGETPSGFVVTASGH